LFFLSVKCKISHAMVTRDKQQKKMTYHPCHNYTQSRVESGVQVLSWAHPTSLLQ
jgi:hypothetical protein